MRTSKDFKAKLRNAPILSKRPRPAVVVASKLLTYGLFVGLMGLAAVKGLQMRDDYGHAGILGPGYAGAPLACGGTYQPDRLVVAYGQLPCGSQVVVINPANDARAYATVVDSPVQVRGRRVADVSPAVAAQLGVDPGGRPVAVVIRPAGGLAALTARLQVVQAFLPRLPAAPYYTAAQQTLLAKLMFYEGRGNGVMGMLATGAVTLNRVRLGHNGLASLQAVVEDPNAYEWVRYPQVQAFNPRAGMGAVAMEVAKRLLEGQLLPDELALATRLGNADHFHSLGMAKYPYWSRIFQRVAFDPAEERKLGHRFYDSRRYDGISQLLASR